MTSNLDEEQLLWNECTTIEDACELTALWLVGSMSFSPFNSGSPCIESEPLIKTLAMANRMGLLTTCSQPGLPMNAGFGQRAFVDGYCSDRVAAGVMEVLLPGPLVTLAIPPGVPSSAQVCVTVEEHEEFTWLGGANGADTLSQIYTCGTNPQFVGVLAASWRLQIFDPEWGRNDRLWRDLIIALGQAL